MRDSRLPTSSQDGTHPRLAEIVKRHLGTRWHQPLRGHSQAAFARLAASVTMDQGLVLDAGCGTGRSTAALAQIHPDCLVIGVDRSASRLARAPILPANACLVRADLTDFWRLARAARWTLERHYLLYPNPWPKARHLRRRWHAHPVWPDLLGLGGQLELRTNFELYAEEFAAALELADRVADVQMLSLRPDQTLTPFEAKYLRSGHGLFQVRAILS